MKKLLFVVILFALPSAVWAADQTANTPNTDTAQTVANEQWRYPEAGLSIEYPGDWGITLQEENFEFVLFMPNADGSPPSNFVGLQLATMRTNDTLQGVMDGFAESFGGEVAEDTFGGVDALRLDLPVDANGRQGILLAYSPAPNRIALLIASGAEAAWETFSAGIDTIIETAEVSQLALDRETLNAQLQASFEDNQTLAIGDKESPVVVLEVLDYSCPHCATYSSDIKWLIHDYALTEQVRFQLTFVTFVGTERSETATLAQYCAAEAGFGWDMHEGLFDMFLTAGNPAVYTVDNIVEYAERFEGDNDLDALRTCIEDGTHRDLLTRDEGLANFSDVTSTPAVLIGQDGEIPSYLLSNGELLRGGLPMYFVYDYLDGILEG